jgi:hypothetical protein
LVTHTLAGATAKWHIPATHTAKKPSGQVAVQQHTAADGGVPGCCTATSNNGARHECCWPQGKLISNTGARLVQVAAERPIPASHAGAPRWGRTSSKADAVTTEQYPHTSYTCHTSNIRIMAVTTASDVFIIKRYISFNPKAVPCLFLTCSPCFAHWALAGPVGIAQA